LDPTLSGLASGFYNLDSLTQGFQKSDLIILAGRPSMGKTALGLNIALNTIQDSKLPVLFFSLEMSKEQIMYRLWLWRQTLIK
jgi:replicative DNA helicase